MLCNILDTIRQKFSCNSDFTDYKNDSLHLFRHITLIVSFSACFSLGNLESLELRENMLKSLPESISHLTKLERLDLGGNNIDELVSLFFILYVLFICYTILRAPCK